MPQMCLVFRSRSRPETSCASSLDTLRASVPDEPFKSLDFWHIAAHDRESLVERIVPYMVAHLPQAYLMQTVAAEYGWPCGILSHGRAQMKDDGISSWRQVLTEFWENPSQTTERLLLLAEAWFYTLLRYTYRMRFSARGKRCGNDLIMGITNSCIDVRYTAALTKREIYRLIGIPNKYGATFYKSCYKDAQRCSGWKSLCVSILWFCKSIRFPTHSSCPEQILRELAGNLPSVILQ